MPNGEFSLEKMKTFTFDWNCVISAENGDDNACSVEQLIKYHRAKVIEVGITTVSASENLEGTKTFPASAKQFKSRLEKLGWDDLKFVLGPCVVGLTYIGMCKTVDENFKNEINKIWNVIGGNLQRNFPLNTSSEVLASHKYKKWRNVWCDVHTIWTHINAERDVFVTANTKDFQKKFLELQPLGLRKVCTPKEALNCLM